MGNKFMGFAISIALIVAGLSGVYVLRGTNSGALLTVFGVILLLWEIIDIVSSRKKHIK